MTQQSEEQFTDVSLAPPVANRDLARDNTQSSSSARSGCTVCLEWTFCCSCYTAYYGGVCCLNIIYRHNYNEGVAGNAEQGSWAWYCGGCQGEADRQAALCEHDCCSSIFGNTIANLCCSEKNQQDGVIAATEGGPAPDPLVNLDAAQGYWAAEFNEALYNCLCCCCQQTEGAANATGNVVEGAASSLGDGLINGGELVEEGCITSCCTLFSGCAEIASSCCELVAAFNN